MAGNATTYRDAGVDIDESNRSNGMIRKHVRDTFDSSVITDMGAFAGVVSLEKLGNYKSPVLVSSIDGVGTKLMIARMAGKWGTVGKDIVNHCANDILALGAAPLFFLDYVATGKLSASTMEQILKGMGEACRENGMPLIAGETAEMPGMYAEGDHDVVGCIVGVADRDGFVNGERIADGDVLIGVASSGLHTNGYSLARKVIFDVAGCSVDDELPGTGRKIGDVLLEPHISYSKAVLALLGKHDVRGIAHITGGGFTENMPRILHDGLAVEIEKGKLRTPEIFRFIQEKGGVPEADMYRTFNMGVGLVLIVPKSEEGPVIAGLKSSGHDAYSIGRVVRGERSVKLI